MPANVTFFFTDRDFVTASEPIRFSFSEKEKLRKRKTAQGTAPRSEIHYVAAGRGGDIMNSMRLRPPRPPKETGATGSDRNGMHSGKCFGIRAKAVRSAFPLRAAKQGRGIELVPGGNQDPRLTEP